MKKSSLWAWWQLPRLRSLCPAHRLLRQHKILRKIMRFLGDTARGLRVLIMRLNFSPHSLWPIKKLQPLWYERQKTFCTRRLIPIRHRSKSILTMRVLIHLCREMYLLRATSVLCTERILFFPDSHAHTIRGDCGSHSCGRRQKARWKWRYLV